MTKTEKKVKLQNRLQLSTMSRPCGGAAKSIAEIVSIRSTTHGTQSQLTNFGWDIYSGAELQCGQSTD